MPQFITPYRTCEYCGSDRFFCNVTTNKSKGRLGAIVECISCRLTGEGDSLDQAYQQLKTNGIMRHRLEKIGMVYRCPRCDSIDLTWDEFTAFSGRHTCAVLCRSCGTTASGYSLIEVAQEFAAQEFQDLANRVRKIDDTVAAQLGSLVVPGPLPADEYSTRPSLGSASSATSGKKRVRLEGLNLLTVVPFILDPDPDPDDEDEGDG